MGQAQTREISYQGRDGRKEPSAISAEEGRRRVGSGEGNSGGAIGVEGGGWKIWFPVPEQAECSAKRNSSDPVCGSCLLSGSGENDMGDGVERAVIPRRRRKHISSRLESVRYRDRPADLVDSTASTVPDGPEAMGQSIPDGEQG
ncbi:unnamed protein product [Arabis nemorensis]|uniref:Uncharacterized protein n=1 Tax=Arabis nemorensis TaxID=586526 RepID=A0A565CRF8_9BRAS|nr:unnamed protein product [Arabis nemorensis]